MTVLADTHTLVWAFTDPDRIGAASRRIVIEADVVASVASLGELCIKAAKKGALLKDPVQWWNRNVSKGGAVVLPITESHVMTVSTLPKVHDDPFDRILVAQSIVEGLPLVSRDRHLAQYGIQTIW